MTNTNSVQNVINEVMATRGTTVRVFGQPQEMPATVEKGYVDIIEILEGFKGYEVDTTLPVRNEVVYNEETGRYDILSPYGNLIEGDFDTEEEADEKKEEYEMEEAEPASVETYIEYMEELGYLEEQRGDNSYNWAGNVSNHFNMQPYRNIETGEYLVEFKVHLYGDVRANYTDSVLLKFDNDYFFHEGISEVSGYEEYRGYGIRFSATHEGYEIHNIETDEDMEEQYAWDDVIEYIDSLVSQEV